MSGAKGRFHRVLWCEIQVLNSVSEGEFSMRRILLCGLTVFAFCALLSTVALAGSHNPADYPLRVNIFHHSSYSHYYGPSGIRSLNDVDGEGRANLFENGEPRGFDFRYECGKRLMNSAGNETFRARWKKPGTELEMLLPAGAGTCTLKVEMKDGMAFARRKDGALIEEPAAKFKEWMIKYQYDPEHGKEVPVAPEPKP
jgi:hypothetical protein